MKCRSTAFRIAMGVTIVSTGWSTISQAQPSIDKSLRSQQLPDNFTLVYRLIRRDVRSGGLRKGSLTVMRQQVEAQVQAGQMTQDQFNTWLKSTQADLKKVSPPERSTLTLSSRKGIIFYRLEKNSGLDLAVANGKNSMFYSRGNKPEDLRRGNVFEGYGALSEAFIPFPGAGLPSLPIIKAPHLKENSSSSLVFTGDGPIVHAQSQGPFPYGSCELKVNKVGANFLPSSLRTILGNNTFQNWEFKNYTQLETAWFAKNLKVTQYAFYYTDAKKGTTGPEFEYAYNLVSASAQPVAKKYFTPIGLVQQYDTIQDNRTKKVVAFGFDLKGGSLDNQVKRARWEQSRDLAKIQGGKGKGGGGVVILIILACGGGIWYWRKRQ